MSRRQSSSGEAGFTLVEALVAMIVLSFGLIAVSNLLVVATGSNGIANYMSATTVAASTRMEQLKAVPFTALVAGGDINSDVANFNSDDNVPGVGRIHTRWQVVALFPDFYAITVRSDGMTKLASTVARAEFTTVRTCMSTVVGCPTTGGL